MSIYSPPPGMSVHAACYSIFQHYCSPWKSAIGHVAVDAADAVTHTLDGASFARMCRECPDLGKNLGRTDVDLIFSKCKPVGLRRLDYEHFLDALLGLATRIYVDDDPTKALANLLARFVFGLFDQQPTNNNAVMQQIFNELNVVQ